MWSNSYTLAQLVAYGEEYKTGCFLHTISPRAMKVCTSMEFTEDEHRDITTIIQKIDAFVICETNEM